MRGFIGFCFVGLCCCLLSGSVLADSHYYVWTGCGGASASSAEGALDQVCANTACVGARPNRLGEYSGTSASWQARCCSGVSSGCQWMTVNRHGSACPPGTTYQGEPWHRCVGPEPVPPAQQGDPCINGSAPSGDNSSKIDPANCSVYAYKDRLPSSCLVGGVWTNPCPYCMDGVCNNRYCPTGEQKQDCVPAGYIPPDPDTAYEPDPNQTVPDSGCTSSTGCDGDPPSTPPPPNAGEPDPATGGSVGDETTGNESTSSTSADGTQSTSQKTTTFNPYSGATTVRETVTTTNPDGSTVVDAKTTTTTPNASGNGSGTTTTRSVTRTAADGTVTTETEGSSSTTDTDDTEASKNLASGGDSCAAPPSCNGDAIQCGILLQVWRDNCVFSKLSGGDSCDAPPVCDTSQVGCAALLQGWHDRCPQGAPDQSGINAAVDALVPAGEMTVAELDAAVASDPDYSPDAEVDLSSISIGPTNPSPSGSCPLPFSITVMGVDVAIGSTELCDFTDWISWLVRISASLFALFIITGYGVGRSTGGA